MLRDELFCEWRVLSSFPARDVLQEIENDSLDRLSLIGPDIILVHGAIAFRILHLSRLRHCR
jgi:hypothetical protein